MDKRLIEFIRLFNQEEFFEAHEVLEDLWREETGPSRDFYQGLIQIAACFVHVQRQNPEGAERLFQSASKYLNPYFPAHLNLNLVKLLKSVEGRLLAEGPFPKVYLNQEL